MALRAGAMAGGAPHVRSLVASGRLGSVVGFEARIGSGAFRTSMARRQHRHAESRGGVLDDFGTDIFALLISWLGPLAPVALADDSAGGVEAEAIARVTTLDGISGSVILSRLRSLPNSIVLTGTNGRVEFDLERSRLRVAPKTLLDRAAATGASDAEANALAEGYAAELIAGLRAVRERLVHVWEDDAVHPSAVSDTAARIAGRKVLVAGGTGFIGSRLVEMLVESGAQVTAIVRHDRHAARVGRFEVAIVGADLRSDALDDVVAGHDIAFSFAYDFRRSGAANLALHRNFAEACAHRGVRRFVHSSSIAVYDDWPSGDIDERAPSDAPGSEYKFAKRAIEMDLARRKAAGTLSSAVLQPTIVYGPYSTFWTDRFAERLLAGSIELPQNDIGTCNGVYVDDVVAAAISAAVRDDAGGGPWIISGAQPFAWTQLIGGYAHALGRKLEYGAAAQEGARRAHRRLDPLAIAQWRMTRGALAFVRDRVGSERIDRLRERVAAFSARRGPSVYRPATEDPALYQSHGVCDISRARRELGYEPAFDLENGLRRTCDYIRWRYESRVRDAFQSDEPTGVIVPAE